MKDLIGECNILFNSKKFSSLAWEEQPARLAIKKMKKNIKVGYGIKGEEGMMVLKREKA